MLNLILFKDHIEKNVLRFLQKASIALQYFYDYKQRQMWLFEICKVHVFNKFA